MRMDFSRMTSSTGGTGALTCSAQTGYPLVSKAFTGTRFINYTIAEYTSSAKTQLSKSETGTGSYVTSTEVLTRTKVLSTWDATDYLPKFGTATAPTALSFGTTSANIDIMVSPTAGGSLPPIPFVYGSVASVSDGLGTGSLINSGSTTLNMTSGTVYYWPVLIASQGPFSQFSFRSTSSLTGGSPTLDHSLYEVASDGTPGKALINFTQITAVGTTNTNYTSTALATPVYLVPGWYWGAALHLAAGASGTFTPRGMTMPLAGPHGSYFTNGTAWYGPKTLASQTVLNDPATAATAHSNITSAPYFLWK